MDYVPLITPEKVAFIFETIEAAQVSITDFSHLVSTSRNSLHRWRNTGKVTDRLRFNLAYQTALRMSYAIADKKLPLPDKVAKAQRVSTLRKIIKDASHHIIQ
jgi:hypothetical protein